MNILFLTIGRMESIDAHAIYPDLLRQFLNNGHNVYVVSQRERRTGLPTEFISHDNVSMLYVSTGNITKCNIIEKGLSTISIQNRYLKEIKKYFNDIKFDLILYSTPPITLCGVVDYIKKRDKASTYLLLKDIFPQNAVDIGMMSTKGIKGFLYRYFRNKERKLYAISDYIGCMSEANVNFVLNHNPEVNENRVEVCPNSIEPRDMFLDNNEKISMRKKYGLPLNKKIFVYGGNLGKPQGIPFLIECLRSQKSNSNAFFLVVGDGTEYNKLENFVNEEKQSNIKLMKRLPKDDYDKMVAACDVGMIFLDYRFTIPNFPSRLLSYMQAKIPVLSVTDVNTDIGEVIREGKFGYSCYSNSVEGFDSCVESLCNENLDLMAENAWTYLNSNFSVESLYKKIIQHF